jgi:hypothetical protein
MEYIYAEILLRDVKPCSLIEVYRRFAWIYFFYLQRGRKIQAIMQLTEFHNPLAPLIFQPWRERKYIPAKRRLSGLKLPILPPSTEWKSKLSQKPRKYHACFRGLLFNLEDGDCIFFRKAHKFLSGIVVLFTFQSLRRIYVSSKCQ